MSKAPRWTEEQLAEYRGGRAPDPAKQHKYKAEPTIIDGIRFDSKLEGRYYSQLKLRQAAGGVIGFLRQVPFHLPGRTRLVIDFQEFRADGSVVFVDTKGVETPSFKIKIRQVRELYPWAVIEIVRRVN